ncbi:MAG: hypothetical protein ACREBW_02025 [Candidatus Micrarchaeaceae archaeon]
MSLDIPTSLSPLAPPPCNFRSISRAVNFCRTRPRAAYVGWKRIKKRALMVLVIPALAMTLGACSISAILTDILHAFEIVAIIVALPPASELATFNASQATENMNLQNMSFTSTTGNVTISISDQSTSDLLGQQTFPFYINAQNQVKFTDPSVVTSWVRSFSTYPGYVKLKVSTPMKVTEPGQNQTSTVGTSFIYQGTPWASSSITIYGPHCERIHGQRRCFPARPGG